MVPMVQVSLDEAMAHGRHIRLMKLEWDKSRRMENMSGQVDKNLDFIFMMSD